MRRRGGKSKEEAKQGLIAEERTSSVSCVTVAATTGSRKALPALSGCPSALSHTRGWLMCFVRRRARKARARHVSTDGLFLTHHDVYTQGWPSLQCQTRSGVGRKLVPPPSLPPEGTWAQQSLDERASPGAQWLKLPRRGRCPLAHLSRPGGRLGSAAHSRLATCWSWRKGCWQGDRCYSCRPAPRRSTRRPPGWPHTRAHRWDA